MEDDDGELYDVSADYAHECLNEWEDVIHFLDDWKAGLFVVSMTEVLAMPAVLLVARRIHNHWISEARRDKGK